MTPSTGTGRNSILHIGLLLVFVIVITMEVTDGFTPLVGKLVGDMVISSEGAALALEAR